MLPRTPLGKDSMKAFDALFITVAPGLEGLLKAELEALGVEDCRPGRSGVHCRTDQAGAYRICLWSRLAQRVLLPIAEARIADADQLYAVVRDLPWEEHLRSDATLAVDPVTARSVLTHSHHAALRVKDGVVDRLRELTGERPSVALYQPDLRINAHVLGDRLTLSIDLSGESLHRRGWRQGAGDAPLKETLAAAMLLRGGWPAIAARGGPLIDPMCGSGTLLIEAAAVASDTAPGLLRTHFGFQGWLQHAPELWRDLIDEALARQEQGLDRLPPVLGYDHSPEAVALARTHVQRAGFAGRIEVSVAELGAVRPPPGSGGLLATNPPWGERLGASEGVAVLYRRLGALLREHFAGWQAVVLLPEEARLGLRPDRGWSLRNGPLHCRLECFGLAAGSDAPPAAAGRVTAPVASAPVRAASRVVPPAVDAGVAVGVSAAEAALAEPLANRLRKNLRRLRAWLRREQISCWRVYDADLPEFAVAIDVYDTLDAGRWLHVQEYAPPPSVAPEAAARRLRAACAVLPAVLEAPPEQCVLKVRSRQRGSAQYARQATQGRMLTVAEGPARLLVNLTDYLDTGLFLDHRPLRAHLAATARGQRVLNLFCYTASLTVAAAHGGAAGSLSIDLSRTYLDWAGRNLALNGIDPARHRLLRADCLDWLAGEAAAVRAGRRAAEFDLIVLDPPSFSNSQRMREHLDVQRDHAALVDDAMCLLRPGGELLFSTNLRRFRFEPTLGLRYRVVDRSAWSLPPDFARNPAIHQCHSLRHRAD
jgi:23S rRNA (guanine2445-N2)-methyltransferase / 23S rRNA (guanine2069-N7)-methyltransferase